MIKVVETNPKSVLKSIELDPFLFAGEGDIVKVDKPDVEQGADSGDAAVGVVGDVG